MQSKLSHICDEFRYYGTMDCAVTIFAVGSLMLIAIALVFITLKFPLLMGTILFCYGTPTAAIVLIKHYHNKTKERN